MSTAIVKQKTVFRHPTNEDKDFVTRYYETVGPTEISVQRGLTYKQVQHIWSAYALNTRRAKATVALNAARTMQPEGKVSFCCVALDYATTNVRFSSQKNFKQLFRYVFGLRTPFDTFTQKYPELAEWSYEELIDLRVLALCFFAAALDAGDFDFNDISDEDRDITF